MVGNEDSSATEMAGGLDSQTRGSSPRLCSVPALTVEEGEDFKGGGKEEGVMVGGIPEPPPYCWSANRPSICKSSALARADQQSFLLSLCCFNRVRTENQNNKAEISNN